MTSPLIHRIELTRLVTSLRSRFTTSEWDRDTFRSDPGGYLDYTGAMPHLPDHVRDRVAADAIDLLFTENGWERP